MKRKKINLKQEKKSPYPKISFILFLILINLTFILAEIPTFHQFYGRVLDSHGLVNKSLEIKAYINGEIAGETTSTNGKYGYTELFFVEGGNNYTIDLISFNNTSIEIKVTDVYTDENETISIGESKNINGLYITLINVAPNIQINITNFGSYILNESENIELFQTIEFKVNGILSGTHIFNNEEITELDLIFPCNNGSIDTSLGEECEEGNIPHSCEDYGYTKGTLGCVECKFDFSDCSNEENGDEDGGGGTSEDETCKPKTCSGLGKECGTWNNGCGRIINCGICTNEKKCEQGKCVLKCIDNDKDGYFSGCPSGNDCNDTMKTTYPGAPEICDGLDNDCNGEIDENCDEQNIFISDLEKFEEVPEKRAKTFIILFLSIIIAALFLYYYLHSLKKRKRLSNYLLKLTRAKKPR